MDNIVQESGEIKMKERMEELTRHMETLNGKLLQARKEFDAFELVYEELYGSKKGSGQTSKSKELKEMIVAILRESGASLHYKEIAVKVEQKLNRSITEGQIYITLKRSIDNSEGLFKKDEENPGFFILANVENQPPIVNPPVPTPEINPQP